ncbi:eCIS core domain-containing protein [Desulfoluna spongiiphila]|uniref:eCIS core domain-containing protein n=1 Tax=Desulfoluna spongiiphila TaxID=419481 RepID=A0A1G5BKG0_9BACT|nr:DUF4157 domain-containing protein [Desulfoluna spongiiphila]SCX90671.1 protein of unknown function [Desulfoluna spongiiphila]
MSPGAVCRNPLSGGPNLTLQRALGNRSVQVLARHDAVDRDAREKGVGASMPMIVHGNPHVAVQAKLRASAPGDACEREADRIAHEVACKACDGSAGSAVVVTGRPAPGVPRFLREKSFEERPGTPFAPDMIVPLPRSTGNPLPGKSRAHFESSFGRDFSQVRIHTDEQAALSAERVNAKAYTAGRDIVFGRRQFAPDSPAGRHLLAHELTHVVQQQKASGQPLLLQRSCADNFAGSTPQTCRGSIDVRAGEISMPNISFFHLYVVFTDANGDAWALRGGPGGGGTGYGNIATICGAYQPGFIDYDTRSPSVTAYQGDQACTKARTMKGHARQINGWNIPYAPDGPNCNSVVASMLRSAGLPLRKPNVAAPGFDTVLAPTGPVSAGGLGDRRHRVFLQVNSLDQFRTLGFGYSIDTFEVSGISFPLVLGAEYSIGSQAILGRMGLGVELPLLNIPTTPLAPTHLRLSGGVQGGGQPSEDGAERSMDTLIGGYFQAQLGLDISRFRISPFYRFSALRNLSEQTTTKAHVGGINLGFTF